MKTRETVGHGALSEYISWMSNHRPNLRETCWQVSSSSIYNSYNIVCTWLGWAMAMEILQRYVRDKCHTFEQTPKI